MKNGFRAKELQRRLSYSSKFLLIYKWNGITLLKQITWRDDVDNRIKYNIKKDLENNFQKGRTW